VAALLAGVPVILHVFHGHVFYGYFGALQTRVFVGIERLLARWTDRVITISPSQRRDIAHTYRIASPGKVAVVPLGLDLQPFATAGRESRNLGRAALGVPDGVPLVGYVGRLTAVKNPTLFCSVAERVHRSVPDAHFVLVGDGDLRANVEGQVAAMGLSKQVTLAGWQRDMPTVYASLDALVVPSLNEGTPVTAIEAMAARVPVVGTAVGGLPDLVADGRTGHLAPSGDVEALADCVVRLLRNPQQARSLSLAGQEDVLARFGVERLVRDMETLYEAVLAEKGIRV
jgi:glycosyltransferase involved in cell wall biosynthesis